MQLSCAPRIELRSGAYTATVAPAAGGRVTSLEWHRAGHAWPLLVGCAQETFDEHGWPKAGAFPMVPFANRLAPAGFRFGERVIRPKCGPAGVAVHGFAHRRRWSLVDQSTERAVMRCTHDGLSEGWPWAWSAEQEVKLSADGMTVTVRVKNESAEPMPLGLGWHPYHPVRREVAAADLHIQASSRRELDGWGKALEGTQAPLFAMTRGETAAFDGWKGAARIRASPHGTIHVACRGARRLVVHRPMDNDYLCVEPVSLLPGHLGVAPGRSGQVPSGAVRQLMWSCGFETDTDW